MTYSVFAIFLLQNTQRASWLFASDKVYAVMAVTLVIFLGMLTYLLLTGRKVRQMEQQLKELEKE